MNLRDLHYLVTVADCGQFARAGKICNVSQPSLSMQLKKLENELNVRIFERSGRELIVTQVGKEIIARARSVLKEVGEMRAVAKYHSNDSPEFRLGIIPTIAPYLLPHYLPRIRKAMPDLKLRLVEAQTHLLEEMLAEGSIDAMIASLPLSTKEFRHGVIHTEICFVAVPARHPLAGSKRLNSRMLGRERIMLLDEGHCLRNQSLALCARTGMQENVDFRSTSLETLRQMVAAGEGITLMPASAVRKDPRIEYVACSEKGFARKIGISWRNSTPFVRIIDNLRELGCGIYTEQKWGVS